ncbi:hypothetical protein BABINDRAFT_25613, partial [Babjeviella inositovora NRRL Y-12698]
KREACATSNDFSGDHWGARISAIFAILVTSAIGAFLPILCSKYSFIRLPPWVFFITKFFGSGVIIATAFIHLLSPANEALSTECLGDALTGYPWAFAIALMTLFVLFFAELMVYRFVENKLGEHSHSHFGETDVYTKDAEKDCETKSHSEAIQHSHETTQHIHGTTLPSHEAIKYPSHFSHASHHQDPEVVGTPAADAERESYYGHLVSVFVLEFGIIFH